MKRVLLAVAAVIVIAPVLLALFLYLRYGGGRTDFPDRTRDAEMPSSAMEVVVNLDTPPGNIAVSREGRVFLSLHPEARPALKVVEIADGKPVPFPDASFQTPDNPLWFRNVLGIRIDRQNRLWTLDNGDHGRFPARLLAFDIASRKLVHQFEFPRPIASIGSHLNDFQVSPDGKHLYIADASFFAKRPALVVYDVETQVARRLLESHESVTPDQFIPVVQRRPMIAFGLVAIRPGVDSIALDAQGEWLYYAPVTSRRLYRVRTRLLLDSSLPPGALATHVENYAAKTMSDGITTDSVGGVYLSDLEHSAILRLDPAKRLHTLLRDERLRWPDGFSFGPGGWLYVTCSSLHQVIGLPHSSVAKHAPYQVFRFKPGHEGVPGH